MFGQNKNPNKQQPEDAVLQPPDDPNDNDLEEHPFQQFDQFERQLEELFRRQNWPIDEREPGFPQLLENVDNADADEVGANVKDGPINVMPGFPLFSQRRRQPAKTPMKEPPQLLKEYKDWPKEQQEQFLDQVKELFPELIPVKEAEVKVVPTIEDELRGRAFDRRRGWRKRQAIELQRIIEEERKGFAQKLEKQAKAAKTTRSQDRQELVALLKRGLKCNVEKEELKRLRVMMSTEQSNEDIPRHPLKKIGRNQCSVLPSVGTYHLEDLESKLLRSLFESFTFEGLLILSQLSPKWKNTFISVFECQSILWFSNEEYTSRRFLPIEDCCEECHQIMDSEPVIRVIDNKLIPIIDCLLSKTKHLRCLRLYRFQLDQLMIIKKLSQRCPQLIHIDLTECYDFSVALFKEFCLCFPNVKHLILSATNLNEEMLSHLTKNLVNLTTLVVSATLITGQSLQSLSNNLKRLDIRCCPQLETSAVIQFLKYSGYVKLQHLKIDDYKDKEIYRLIWTFFKTSLLLLEITETQSDSLSGQSYSWDMPLMPYIQSLKLGKNIVFNSRTFDSFINSCPNMRSFSMEFHRNDVHRLSEQSLVEMADKWPLLKRLELISCPFVGQDFMYSLIRLKNLQFLNLTESPGLKNSFMAIVLPKLSKLKYLVLDKCLNLGKRTLESVIMKASQMSPQLMRLSMFRCDFQRLPYIKAKYLPTNLRLSYSSVLGQTYVSFDGQRTRIGQMSDITQFLNQN